MAANWGSSLCLLVLGLAVVFAIASKALAQGAGSAPDAAAKKLIQYGESITKQTAPSGLQGAGEQFGWGVSYSMGEFVSGYEKSKDTAWLDAGVKVFDYCVGKMLPGPDGYKGFVGNFIYNEREGTQYWTDVHVGDSILLAHMLEFAELVLKDPELKKKYGEAAQKYVDVAKRDLIEKWDKRGTWKEDGPYGCYVGWDMFCTAADPNKWIEDPKALLAEPAEPFNKNNDMGVCALRIFRITGEEKYRERAMKVFAYMKSRFQLVDDSNFSYYVWNYWEPFGPESVDLAKKDTRHWMNVHGDRPYQAGEVPQIVEAYNTGVVFDKTDIERILNTNLKVMWNGDAAKPKFANSNWLLPLPPGPDGKAPAPDGNSKAGQLWTGLAQFSQTVRDLAGGRSRGASAEKPPSFDRLWCAEKDAKVFDVPFHTCKSLTAVAVLPSNGIKKGTATILMCKARIPQDTFEVALYSADGKDKLQTIHQGKIDGGTDGHAGIFLLQWDPASSKDKPLKGAYRIRWTGVDGYREFPITVAE
jgi:hypothetical protein